jgi:hypothetical protein
MATEAEWMKAIMADPANYRLPAYEPPHVTIKRAAEYFARWSADDLAGVASPALCRRCGRVLRPLRASQQLHLGCEPSASWPYPAPRREDG